MRKRPGYGKNGRKLLPVTKKRPYLDMELVEVKPGLAKADGRCWVASVEDPHDPADVWTVSVRLTPDGWIFASMAMGPHRQGLGVHRQMDGVRAAVTKRLLYRQEIELDPTSRAVTWQLHQNHRDHPHPAAREFVRDLAYQPLTDTAWADRLGLPMTTDVREVYKHAVKSLPQESPRAQVEYDEPDPEPDPPTWIPTDVDIRHLANAVTQSYVRRYAVHSRHREDVYSDALFGIAQALPRVRIGSSEHDVRAYLYTRAKGAIIDGIRQRNPASRRAQTRTVVHSYDLLVEDGWAPVPVYEDFDRLGEIQEAKQLAPIALEVMTPKQRAVVLAVDVQGMPQHVLAAQWGCDHSNISALRSAAFARARTALEPLRPA